MRTVLIPFVLLLLLASTPQLTAQGSWKRGEVDVSLRPRAFHSMHSLNLPTTESMRQGHFEFEVSHRFVPTIKDGSRQLWGFDGPSNIRLGLSWAYHDDGYVTLGRSNVQDNYDFTATHRFLALDGSMPLLAAVRAGVAWSTEVAGRDAGNNRNFQYFAQLMLNTAWDKRVALGVVPSYLYNAHITCPDVQYSLTLGVHGTVFITDVLHVTMEWNPTVSGWRTAYNVAAFGIELETGGHFFKIVATNSDKLNTSQVLPGSTESFGNGEWHLGFNITRLLVL
jgi:hypothetical protein